ncbi:MAG: hypothetical protein JW940_30440 [Polyangiaceae bacterium]|nr:hypothetical protein [Polyangiaceae bacterium]
MRFRQVVRSSRLGIATRLDCGAAVTWVFGLIHLACSSRVSGSCDTRVDETISNCNEFCCQYEDVEYEAEELQTTCEEQNDSNGKWKENGTCSGEVVATCRYGRAGGTITEYYYGGTPSDCLKVASLMCTSSSHKGTWCNGTDCP